MATANLARLDVRVHAIQGDFVADDHHYALLLGGIGSGKTTAGAIKALCHITPGSLGLVIAPTFRMLRDATWRTALEVWQAAGLAEQVLRGDELRVGFANGAEALFRSAEDPERLRGPNASWCWIDEGALCHPDTWPISIGRLRQHGVAGPCWVTTTPKPRNPSGPGENWARRVFVTDKTDETALYRVKTAENPFLPEAYVRSLRSQYTARLASQELDADWLTDVEGALWNRAVVEASETRACPALARVVVAVDPAVSSGADSDLTGIVVAAIGEDGRGYVLWSGGVRMTPDGWARKVVALYHDFRADRVVAEANQGGALVEAVLRTIDPSIPIKLVHATKGKRTRAEPVAALFEQGRVSLVTSDTIHA